MSNEVIEAAPRSLAVEAAAPANSPMGMMMAAMKQGATLEQVEKMMDLQQRWEEREAGKAFNDAMAAFKAEAVEIIKRRQVDFANKAGGRTNYKHAELSDVIEAAGPALSKHGFSWSWKTEQTGGVVRVTCILKHRMGHSDSVYLEAPPDQSGGKNTIQATISTVTYLERHTFKAVAGLSEKGDDTDGSPPLDMGIIDDWIAAMQAVASIDEWNRVWKDGLREIRKTNSIQIQDRFRDAAATAKKRLEGA